MDRPKFSGFVESRDDYQIVGWAINNQQNEEAPIIVVLDDDQVICVAEISGERQDVADHMGCSPICQFKASIPDDLAVSVENLTVAAVGARQALHILAECEQRDRTILEKPVRISVRTANDAEAFYKLPNTSQLDSELAVRVDLQATVIEEESVFFEITDLVSFLRNHNSVTGIQRTVCGIINHLTSSGNHQHRPFYFCSLSERLGSISIYRESSVANLIENVFAGRSSIEQFAGQIDEMSRTSLNYVPKKGQSVFISGAYWIVSDFDRKLFALKRNGVVIGAYIYDIIPITNPQWVTTSTNREVLESAFGVFYLSDYFITISEFVKRELDNLIRVELGCSKPIEVAALPHEIPKSKDSRSLTLVRGRMPRYVLCVCTLEGRKNHMLLYRVWAALLRKHGIDNVPSLVLVGRWGWRIDDFRENCLDSDFLDGKIIVKSSVQDEELVQLYEDCLFTVFPSFVEGWGLPVGESLSFSKFCLASNSSSIPEVGGKFVDYFDPYNFDDAFIKIDRAISDPNYLQNRTKDIENNFVSRTWAELTQTLMVSSKTLTEQSSYTFAGYDSISPLLESGEVWDFSKRISSQVLPWKSKQARFALLHGWNPLEARGAWSSAPAATISFRVNPETRSFLKVWMLLHLPNSYEGEEIVVRCGDVNHSILAGTLTDVPRWFEFDFRIKSENVVTFQICRPRYFARVEDGQYYYVGLSALAISPVDDLVEETRLLRRLIRVAGAY